MGSDANAFRRNLIFLDSLLLANGQQRGMDMPAILGDAEPALYYTPQPLHIFDRAHNGVTCAVSFCSAD